MGLVAGLVFSEIGGMTVTLQRHMVARVFGRTDSRSMTAPKLTAVHISSVAVDFVRGMVVTAVGNLGLRSR